MDCNKCSRPAITFIRYSGSHLCENHFSDFFQKRVRKEVRKQCRLRAGTRMAVALSGGKDSTVATWVLYEIMSRRRDTELHALMVDEGIEGYRPESLELAKKFCRERGMDYHIVAFKNLVGFTMDEIAEIDRQTIPCTYCGVFRRKALNMKAREISADYLATGLNLDDTAQSILMNFVRADIEKLARMGPHSTIQKNLVPRIQPLRATPEKEVYLFSMLNGIEVHNADCPYADRAFRSRFRNLLYDLEKASPGTRHGILRTYDLMRPALESLYPPARLKSCQKCGEPTASDFCKACILIDRLKAIL